MSSKARTLLDEGRRILDPFFERKGFTFETFEEGSSSGGDFAVGRYTREDRTIELHVRHGLGIVNYYVGDTQLSHPQLVQCLGIQSEETAYPGFSEEPVHAFSDLRKDLEGPLSTFFEEAVHERFVDFARHLQSGRAQPRLP